MMPFQSILLALLGGGMLLTVANLLRDTALAAAFGASHESDIIFLAISIPAFLTSVGANAFRSVSIPALGRLHAMDPPACRAGSQRFLAIALAATALVATVLAVIAALLYAVDPAWFGQASLRPFMLLLAAIVPMFALAASIEVWQGPFQVWGHYLGPALLRLGLPCGIALAALISRGASVYVIALGGLLGAGLCFVTGILQLARLGIAPGPGTVPLPEDTRRVARAGFVSLVLATCITYANPLVDQWIAALAGEGSISLLGYANRLTTGVATLVAGALAQALLVRYSHQLGAGNRRAVQDTFGLVVRVVPWVGCFATLGTWLTSGFFVTLIYQHGAFDGAMAERVAALVDIYALQFPVYWTSAAAFTLVSAAALNRLFLPIGIVLFAVNLASDFILVNIVGLPGIALTTSVVYVISWSLLNLALKKSDMIALRPADFIAGARPFVLLALAWPVLRQFDLALSLDATPQAIAGAVALLLAFGGIGAGLVGRDVLAAMGGAREAPGA